MPISNLIIEAGDYIGHDVDSLSLKPSADGIDAETLQKRFDAPAKEVVGPALNALIAALLATAAGDSGAANIGVELIPGVSGATVQAAMENLKTQLDATALGFVPNGSVTDEKLSQAAGALIARFAAHTLDFASHFHYLGMTGGTDTAYTASDTGFTLDTTKVNLLAVRAHADCGSSPTLKINSAGAMTIRPNGGSALAAAQMRLNGVYLMMWYPAAPSVLHILNPETVTLELTIGNVTGLTAALSGKAQSAHTHAQGDVTGLIDALNAKLTNSFTASRVLVSDGAGKAAVSSLGAAQLGHLANVWGDVQSQLNGKAASGHDHNAAYLGLYSQAADSFRVRGFTVFVQSAMPSPTALGDIWFAY